MSKFLKVYYLIIWTMFVLAMLAFPGSVEQDTSFHYLDKVAHFVFFSVFAYLVYEILHELKVKVKIGFVLAYALTLLFVLFGEFIQIYVPGRESSAFDMLFGILGAMTAIIYVYVRYPRKKRNKRKKA